MEDEECLPENCTLKNYLQTLGYSDFEVTENMNVDRTSLKFELSQPETRSLGMESIDEEVIDQIGVLISTQMLFDEDISSIEKVLSSFKITKNGMMKSMFKGFFGVAVIFVGLCLYWIIGNYAFIIVSSFYAYNAAYYLKRRHFNKSRLKKLTMILQTNFLLLKKAIRFIEENNRLVESNVENMKNIEFMEGFDYYNNFKSDFVVSIKDMINIFIKSTQKLIKAIPLYDYVETPNCYLCNNLNDNYESISLSNLYQIYLLIQSEFLRRLSLSLIPNINLPGKNNNFRELNSVLTEACVNLLKIKNKLNKKFKFIFLNGVHCPDKEKIMFKSPPKARDPGTVYRDELVSNIHETSNTFQDLLIKSRILENSMTYNKIPENVEDELVNMQNNLNSCQRNIADSFILLKKAHAICDAPEVVKPQEEHHQSDETEKIVVGYTDLDPKIEDEIFEAYFTEDKPNTDLCNIDDWDFDDRLKKKLEKEYSKSVIKELKIKLVEKAKNWEKREAEIMRKKGIVVENKDKSKEISKESPINLPNNDINGENIKNEELKSNSNSQNINEINTKDSFPHGFDETKLKNLINNENNEDDQNGFEEYPQSCVLLGSNKGFLSDLGEARQRILKSSAPAEEEFYCGSSEDSNEDDS